MSSRAHKALNGTVKEKRIESDRSSSHTVSVPSFTLSLSHSWPSVRFELSQPCLILHEQRRWRKRESE